jgi:hypothetical protein
MRRIVANNVAVGGRTLDELHQDHTIGTVEYWGRIPSWMSQVAALAGSGNFHTMAGAFVQGESEYLLTGSSMNRGDYKSLLASYHTDFVLEALANGNTRPPGFFVWQVGGEYARNVDGDGNPDLFVGMAQWEFARETSGVYLVGPISGYYNKINHCNYQGVQAAGFKQALVMDRVINLRQNWEPLSPLAVERGARTIRVHFHVPAPPLQFATTYRDNVAQDFAAKGFRVTDASGTPSITSVSLVGQTMVDIVCDRDFVGQTYLWYADNTVHGRGNLMDSEEIDPLHLYQYLAGSGDYASVDIAVLVDQPQDMRNRAIAFYLPASWERT